MPFIVSTFAVLSSLFAQLQRVVTVGMADMLSALPFIGGKEGQGRGAAARPSLLHALSLYPSL